MAWRLVPASRSQVVDQVGGAAKGGELCKDSVDGSCHGEGPAFWRAVRPGRLSGSGRTEAP